VSTCDVFYWSDYNRDPVISPVIVPGSGTGDGSTASAGATITTPSSSGANTAEGAEGRRRLLQTTCAPHGGRQLGPQTDLRVVWFCEAAVLLDCICIAYSGFARRPRLGQAPDSLISGRKPASACATGPSRVSSRLPTPADRKC
jgi:hypothetical protein